jgi:hypothetical protein
MPALTTFCYIGMHELESCDLLKTTNTSLSLKTPSGGHESKVDVGGSCEVDQSIAVTAEIFCAVPLRQGSPRLPLTVFGIQSWWWNYLNRDSTKVDSPPRVHLTFLTSTHRRV